jgi:elongation factor P hydroxylase
LSAKDAFSLVDGSARRNLDHENAWHDHTARLAQWQAERENVRRAAFNAEWDAGVKRGYGNSASTDRAHEAAREALAAYDKANPEPVFAEPESRLQRVIARVKAGTR